MAGSSTARGAQADAAAESNADAQVEVSSSGVEVSPEVTDKFETVELVHRNGQTRTVHTLEAYYAAKFDGFAEPKADDKKSKKS
jgi:hypothetical protein